MQYINFAGTGIKVSRLCLGTANFTDDEVPYKTVADRNTRFALLDQFREQGGNFVDAADIYGSEIVLGEYMRERSCRSDLIIGTKFGYQRDTNLNYNGNNKINIRTAVERSLQRLKTDYIDIVYSHIQDRYASTADFLEAVEPLVSSGKVLYVGLSNWEPWRIVQALYEGGSRFIKAIQCEYNLLNNEAEFEYGNLAREFGLQCMAYSTSLHGVLLGRYDENQIRQFFPRIAHRARDISRIVAILRSISRELSQSPSELLLHHCSSRGFLPVIGVSDAEQLRTSLACVRNTVADDVLGKLHELTRSASYPYDIFASAEYDAQVYGNRSSDILSSPAELYSQEGAP